MNVFVLCTGRCGSLTFTRACENIENWSCAHESRTHLTGAARFAYPDSHIEADNRLSWMLGRLEAAYGDRARYVHLTRDPEAVANSFLQRADRGILAAYRTQILMRAPRLNPDTPMLDFCRDYVDTVTQNILAFLHNKSQTMTLRLEHVESDFSRFWDWIGADGDRDAAMREWGTRHNASEPSEAVPADSDDAGPR